jgi:hypothetical protein
VCRFVVRLENMTTVCNSRLSGDKVGGSYRSSLVSSEPFKARALSLGVVRAREHMKLRSRADFPVYPFTSLTSRLNFGPHSALSTHSREANLYKLKANFIVIPKTRALAQRLARLNFAILCTETSPRPSSRLLPV